MIESTRFKLAVARTLHRVLRPVIGDAPRLVTRGGVRYELDPKEGIDLSIFVLGAFQRHVLREATRLLRRLPPGAVVFDVGANIGSFALPVAHASPDARVHAFEPTAFAFAKLLRNLSLNPSLSGRIVPSRAFVAENDAAAVPDELYASWRVDGRSPDAHEVHGGTMQPTRGASVTSIDAVVSNAALSRLDLVKIDTDGSELRVLRGGRTTLATLRPFVIFEIGLYELGPAFELFAEYDDLFKTLDYRLVAIPNGRPIQKDTFLREIPAQGTIDVLAIPPDRGI